MSVNGITASTASYQKYDTANKENRTKTNKTDNTSSAGKQDSAAAIYESSSETSSYKVKNAALIEQLKADSDSRVSQMKSLVQKMFEKQGISIGTADDIWKVLASGNFTADPDTIAQAKEDISENGYWGVKQTSERIFSFATALAGDNEEQMQKMKDAVKKGFQEATKSWGKSLPDISNNTYDAVMKKFDDWFDSKSYKQGSGSTTDNATATDTTTTEA